MLEKVLFSLILVTLASCTTWPCVFDDGGEWYYDFTSVNENPNDPSGFYSTTDDSGNDHVYTWKLCDPNFADRCGQKENSQVCQDAGVFGNESLGIGEPTPAYTFFPNGGGVVMTTKKGSLCPVGGRDREVTLNVECSFSNDRQNFDVDPAIEGEVCLYTINMYLDAACGSPPPPPPPSSYCTNGPSVFTAEFQFYQSTLAKCTAGFYEGIAYYSFPKNFVRSDLIASAPGQPSSDLSIWQDFNVGIEYVLNRDSGECTKFSMGSAKILPPSPNPTAQNLGTTLYGPAVVTATSIPLNLPEFGVKDYSLIRAVSQDCMTMNLQVKNQNGFPVAYEQIYNLVPTIFAMKDPFTVPNACLTSRMQRGHFDFMHLYQ